MSHFEVVTKNKTRKTKYVLYNFQLFLVTYNGKTAYFFC